MSTTPYPAGVTFAEQSISILLLEDYQLDADLMCHEIHSEFPSWSVRHVKDRAGFIQALAERAPDVIIADYALPMFTGLEALQLVQQEGLEIPFILVTGQLPEETLLDTIKQGVDDYVVKSSLMRLGVAVNNALVKRHGLNTSRNLKLNLVETENRFTHIFHHAGVPLCEVTFRKPDDIKERYPRLRKLSFDTLKELWSYIDFELCNDSFLALFGALDVQELQAHWSTFFIQEETTAMRHMLTALVNDHRQFQEKLEMRDLEGARLFAQIRFTASAEKPGHYIMNVTDITDVKRSEQRLNKVLGQMENIIRERTQDLTKANQVMRQQADEREHMTEVLRTNFLHMTESIIAAKHIQQLMLPSRSVIQESFEQSFVYWRPKDIVSGDFYWHYQKGNACWIAAVDCTGHGVPGAFMSMNGSNFLSQVVIDKQTSSTADIMNGIDDLVIREMKQHETDTNVSTGMDMSMCHFDFDTMEMRFSGAFHNLYFIRDGELTIFKGERQAIGGTFKVDNKRFTEHIIPLQKGDRIYMTTDGYYDQFGGERDKKFTKKRFTQMLTEFQDMALIDQEMELKTKFQDWKGRTEQVDDILVIGLEV